MARKQHAVAGALETRTFEQNLERLEAIVKQLEESELTLEDALKLFDEGIAVSEGCRKQLEDAEHRVEILTKRAGNVVARPLEDSDAEEE